MISSARPSEERENKSFSERNSGAPEQTPEEGFEAEAEAQEEDEARPSEPVRDSEAKVDDSLIVQVRRGSLFFFFNFL